MSADIYIFEKVALVTLLYVSNSRTAEPIWMNGGGPTHQF